MEVKQCWVILTRWRWIALLPSLVIVGIGLATYSPPPPTYTTTINLSAGLPPSSGTTGSNKSQHFDSAYYSWISSEYFVASLSDWVKTGSFAHAVSTQLQSQGFELSPAAVKNGLMSDYVRSQLVLYFTAGSQEQLIALAKASIKVLQTKNAAVFPQLGGQNASIIPLDEPIVTPVPVTWKSIIDLGLRVGVGLGVGIMLAFLAHYLDPMVRTRADVEQLPIEFLGQIPPAESE